MDKKTPKPKVKSVSFKYKHFDCYDYIKDMSNFSDYICDLIRLDMEHGLIRKIYNLPQSTSKLKIIEVIEDNAETLDAAQPEPKVKVQDKPTLVEDDINKDKDESSTSKTIGYNYDDF
jgi:hypothetical protein